VDRENAASRAMGSKADAPPAELNRQPQGGKIIPQLLGGTGPNQPVIASSVRRDFLNEKRGGCGGRHG